MVDLTSAFGYSYSILAGDLNEPAPSPFVVRDLLGSTFRDYSLALGLTIPSEYMIKYELRFYAIFEKILDRLPQLQPTSGCRELLTTVVTSLPRALALKVLVKAGLSSTFETRVNPDRLLCHNIDEIVDLLQLASSASSSSPSPVSSTTIASSTSISEITDAGILNELSMYSSNFGDKYIKQRINRGLAIMKKHPALTACIDGNRRQIVAAKRAGADMI